MAVFGRRSYEDDAERAVAPVCRTQATRSWSAEVEARFGVTPRMRVGIDTGEVVVSTLGERAGHEFVAVGPTVNRASRPAVGAPEGRRSCRPRRTARSAGVQRALGARPGLKGLGLPGGRACSSCPSDRAGSAGPARRRRGHRGEHGRPGPARSSSSRSGSSTSSTRVNPSSSTSAAHRQEPAAARLRPVARGTAASGVVVPRARVHVEQDRANSLTRDVIATRMEIAESDPRGGPRSSRPASPWPTGG